MQSTSTVQAVNKLTQLQSLTYGLPLLSVYFLMGPIALLQGIYAKHFGLPLTTIASVLLIARFFDALTDPIIGYCADRYYARYGNRKPFIIVGVVLFVISSWFLYVPFGFDSEPIYTSVSAGYFLAWFLAFYLSFTLFEIPHMAWGSELASDSQEKNRVYGMRAFCGVLGTLLFFAMPLLPWFETDEFTPQTLKWSVLVAGSMALPLLYLCIKTVPNKKTPLSIGFKLNQSPSKENLYVAARAIVFNKSLWMFTCAHICTGFGYGMYIALLFIFSDAYLNLGPQFALLFVISLGASMGSLKLWFILAMRWGKQIAWMVGMVLVVIGLVGTGLMSSENTGRLELLLCMTLIFSGFAAFNIVVPSLLSDIVDYGTWKFGIDRAATYFSLYTFINKTLGALGGALGLAIAGWVEFDPTVSSHSDTAIAGLRLSMAWMPVVFLVLSIIFITRITITSRRHAVIRRRLDRCLIRAAYVDDIPSPQNIKSGIEVSSKNPILSQPFAAD